jgi:hypothetical protein
MFMLGLAWKKNGAGRRGLIEIYELVEGNTLQMPGKKIQLIS